MPIHQPSVPGRVMQDTPNELIIRFPRPICARQLYLEAKMAIGTVKFFNSTRGFGFIQPEDGDKDVFVHKSAVELAGMDTLQEGQRIRYELISERGKTAAGNLEAA